MKLQLLRDVSEKRITLKQMNATLENIKKLSTLRKQIRNYLNVPSFEIAAKKFPGIVNDEHLNSYLKFKLESIPELLKVRWQVFYDVFPSRLIIS